MRHHGASSQTLVNLLSLSPNLASLDLSQNNLGPSALQEAVDWMEVNAENCSVRRINVSDTGLGDKGLAMLVPILKSVDELRCQRCGITSAGMEAMVNAHKLIQLTLLDLEGNSIGEEGIHALTLRFQQEHKRSLWNPKQLTSNIDTVVLRNNGLPTAVQKSTEAFLKIHLPRLHVEW